MPGPREPVEAVIAGELGQQVSYPQAGTAVLTVTGTIDAATVPRLGEMLRSRLRSQLARLVLDLSQVGFLAVAGVSTLRTVEHWARQFGTAFVIVTGTNRAVTRALQATAGQHALRWQPGPVTSALLRGDVPAGG